MYIKTSSTLTSWVLVPWVLSFPESLILQVYTAIKSLKMDKRKHNWMAIYEKILLASMYNCTPNHCWKKLLVTSKKFKDQLKSCITIYVGLIKKSLKFIMHNWKALACLQTFFFKKKKNSKVHIYFLFSLPPPT